MAAPLPAEITAVAAPQPHPNCNSYALYEKKDYAAARACAIQERAVLIALGPRKANGTGGEIVLAQLYANGEGVAQNGALAARFVCEAMDSGEIETPDPNSANAPQDSGWPAEAAEENKNILATLAALKAVAPGSPDFAFCNPDDPMATVPDTPATRYCDDLWEEAHAKEHSGGIEAASDAAQLDADEANAAIKPVLAKFNAVQHAAYDHVSAADQHFIDAMATGELLYPAPYGNGGLYLDEMRADFENTVAGFVAQLPPVPKPDEVAAADRALNSVYRQLIAAATPGADVTGSGTNLDSASIRTEERAWLAYRDAFVVFGKTLAPNLPASAWILPLTAARTHALMQVYDIAGKDLIQAAEKERQRLSEATAHDQDEIAQARARVSKYFDHQTPAQAAAWKRVEAAFAAYASAHKDAAPGDLQGNIDRQFESLYGELYVIQVNTERGELPVTEPAREAAGYTELDKKLNATYQADLASDCLFTENLQGPFIYRSPAALRAEQRAWLKLRDAWVDFLGTLFPTLSKEERANMFVGGREFELRTRAQFCHPRQ